MGAFLNENSGAISAIAALFIMAFTIALWRATNGLRDSTDRLWEAADKQGKDFRRSLAISVRSMQIARQASRIAGKQVQATRNDIQAWIFAQPSPGKFANRGDGAGHQYHMHVINYGRTLGLVTKIGVQSAAEVPTGNPEKHPFSGKVIDLAVPLQKGPPVFVVEDHAFDLPENHRIIFGFVEYQDVFGRTFVSRFCGRMVLNPGVTKYIPTGTPGWNHIGKKKPAQYD